MSLKKATLAELDDKNQEIRILPVQFNPTSLRLQISNTIEGGENPGRQVRQFIGSSSTTLSLDLVFDTADEASTSDPRSVRERTDMVERFLRPRGTEDKKFVTPRIRFHWNDLVFDGIVDSITIDFDHFAANGAPLRAKVSLAIKEQNPDLELLAKGPGANRAGFGANVGVGFSASAGLSIGASASIGVALEGESASEFAARVGVDPTAWRGLALGGESSLSLSAGAEIGFDKGLGASAGLGVTSGVEAGASASPEAKFGLQPAAGLNAVPGVGVGSALASGFALSSAGGVSAAINAVESVKNVAAESQARHAFNAQPSSSVAALRMQPGPPDQPRTPLSISNQSSSTSSAPPTVKVDQRANTFGHGVPLRVTVGKAADLRASSIQGNIALRPRAFTGDPPLTTNPTTPSWIALPARDATREESDRVQGRRRPLRPCGCAGRCKH